MALKKTVRGKQKVSSQSILSKNNVSNNEQKIQDALNKYHNYLEVEKNYSVYTIQNYFKDIDEFKTFINEAGISVCTCIFISGISISYE